MIQEYYTSIIDLVDKIVDEGREKDKISHPFFIGKIRGVERAQEIFRDVFGVHERRSLHAILMDKDENEIRRRVYKFQRDLYEEIWDYSSDYGTLYHGDDSTYEEGFAEGLIDCHKRFLTITKNIE